MTDTNMTDTNIPHSGGGVPQDCGKHVRVLTTQRNDEDRRRAAAVGGVWFRGLLCSVWHNTWCVVVLGVLVVIVAGSRPVVLFEPGC